MKKGTLLAAIGIALAMSFAVPSSAQAHWCHCHHWHHWHHWWHPAWVAPTIDYVTSWWENPYYYYSPYSIVDHVLVHRVTEVGPIHYPVVLVAP
jgi:hypothetical protein